MLLQTTAASNGLRRWSKRPAMLHPYWALLAAGVHQAGIATKAGLRHQRILQLLHPKPLYCAVKPGRVAEAAGCTADWWHYFCLSQKLLLAVGS